MFVWDDLTYVSTLQMPKGFLLRRMEVSVEINDDDSWSIMLDFFPFPSKSYYSREEAKKALEDIFTNEIGKLCDMISSREPS